jgi:hypothetical protein
MTETATRPTVLKTAPDKTLPPETDGKDGSDRLGRALDIAGICAAVVLGVIIFDVISGGKVTRLFQRRKPPCPPGVDCPDPEGPSGDG